MFTEPRGSAVVPARARDGLKATIAGFAIVQPRPSGPTTPHGGITGQPGRLARSQVFQGRRGVRDPVDGVLVGEGT